MRVIVETSVEVEAPADSVWRLLCDARLPLTAPCCFTIGVPTPESCTLISERGQVGAHRQCRTKQGVINQRITEWAPPSRLTFEMESETLGLDRHIASMVDTFRVEAVAAGSRLARRTVLETRGWLAVPRACVLRAAVWHIHRYVMRNFKALAEAA